MTNFNVMFFDIHCKTEFLTAILDDKLNSKHFVNDVQYRITCKEHIAIEANEVILLEIEKYNKKPATLGVHDDKNLKLENANYLSNINYCIFDVKKKVCLLQNNKNGISISTLKDLLNTNNTGFNIDFTLKITKKEWREIKDIKTLTISQKGTTQKSLFNIGESPRWFQDLEAELGTVTIKITAKKNSSLPRDKVFQGTKSLTENYKSFKIEDSDNKIYDLIKNKLSYQSTIAKDANKDIFKTEMQSTYKVNLLKI